MFDPITIALVVGYFLFRRGGENVMWLARRDGSDPPSFRRWQERQKRRGVGGSVTGRAEGRKFWAHVWHDAHESAHEWQQRRHGRALENRRKRWQEQDVERQKQQSLAPCVFCGAGHGEDCAADCPERQAHDTNRAIEARATVPPTSAAAKPAARTEPSQPRQTVPSKPSHDADAKQDDRATPAESTEPPNQATSQATTKSSATESATAGSTKPSTEIADDRRLSLWKSDEEELAFKEQHLEECKQAFNDLRDRYVITERDEAEHMKTRHRLENDIACLRRKLGKDQPDNVTPINRNQAAVNRQTANGNTSGGNVTTTNVTGEIAGYEAVLAEHDQTIAHLESVHADAERRVAEFEQLDAVYENRINGLRSANADGDTIGTQLNAREANETQISAAKAALEAAAVHLEAEQIARARWVAGIGAMKETADATGAEGDRVLRS